MATTTERAIRQGCFWGMQQLVRRLPHQDTDWLTGEQMTTRSIALQHDPSSVGNARYI
jgi:hypothetical protein